MRWQNENENELKKNKENSKEHAPPRITNVS
jgi:hypothetical protein